MTRLETKRPRSDLTRPVRSDWALIEPGQLADRVGQQRVLGGVPQPGRGWDDQPARSAPGVLGHFADLTDVPEFVGLAELALPDGPGVRVGDRDQPVDDRLPRDPLLDLG